MPPSLASGRSHLAIPGPSIMPDRVLRAMHRAAPNIYEGALLELADSVFTDLNRIARNSGEVIVYIGNGHAAWEASLVNTLSKGDRVLALVTGRFGKGWVAIAKGLGIDVQVLEFGQDKSVDPVAVEAALRADTERKIKAVITVQTDTATSVTNDIPRIRQAMTASEHPALLMVDSIASFACEVFDMDAWGVDVMLTGCQKGLMTPPGLGIVFIRDTVWPFHAAADLKTPYWDWASRILPQIHERFCGTSPTHHLYGLREALDMLFEEGMENVWTRHHIQAQAVWAAVEAWSDSGALQLNVPLEADRSWAVSRVNTQPGLAVELRQWCEQQAGLTLGVGLSADIGGNLPDDQFRIGHMGHLNPHGLLGTLACIEAGLKALGVNRISGGVESAMKVLVR